MIFEKTYNEHAATKTKAVIYEDKAATYEKNIAAYE